MPSLSPVLQWTRILPEPDPSTGTSPLARSSHGLSFLQNPPRLFLYGGEHQARTPLDPDQAAWELLLVDGGAATTDRRLHWRRIDCRHGPPPRIAHAQAVDVGTNAVYVFGGRAGVDMQESAMNDMWCYRDKEWLQIEYHYDPDATDNDAHAPPCPRSFHRIVCIDGALYVFGGCGSQGRLNDLHKFDLKTRTWESLPSSSLRGRGGANLIPLSSERKLGVVAGFAGEETNDGQVFDIADQSWAEEALDLSNLRPRSVCASASFPSVGISVIFGGEVNPSDLGHQGAGGFANDICILDERSGSFLKSVGSTPSDGSWPEERGWADAAFEDSHNGSFMYLFGGLTGDDANPRRLDDLWKLQVRKP